MHILLTVPNILTLIRFFFPFIFSFCVYYLVPLHYVWLNIFLAVLFFAVSFTDYLDGYFARIWQQETELGKILDPVTDKMFVAGPFIALVAIHRLYFYWAVLLISRELFISALREVAAQKNISISVSWWGKWKATIQYSYIFFVVGAPWPWGICFWLEKLTLTGALLLSIVSAVLYVRSFIRLNHTLIIKKLEL